MLNKLRPVIALVFITISGFQALAQDGHAIPPDNLAYPVLIEIDSKKEGTGFFINTSKSMYFVTAKHVITNPKTGDFYPNVKLFCQPRLSTENKLSEFTVNLTGLKQKGFLLQPEQVDAIAFRFGTRDAFNGKQSSLTLEPEVSAIVTNTSGIVGVTKENCKRFDSVLVGNDAIIFDYPVTLGILNTAQIDFSKPLLRKGIIAGLNALQRTIIIDCPAYGGNSGGPVIQIEEKEITQREFKVIGVVVQFVPAAIQTVSVNQITPKTSKTRGRNQESAQNAINVQVVNSGYSVAVSIDSILSKIEQFEKGKQ